MSVQVMTAQGPIDHPEGKKAHWTDSRFLEVYGENDRVIAIHAPDCWEYVTVKSEAQDDSRPITVGDIKKVSAALKDRAWLSA